MQKIVINGKTIKLDPSQLIQSGGEGMVFDLGNTAVKLYHTPTAEHRAKLTHLLKPGAGLRWPDGVLGPKTAVYDVKNQLIGFQMCKLPTGSQPVKRLANPVFWQQQNITPQVVITLLQHIHNTLTALHQQQIIVGDLNDTNLFFTPQPGFTSAWIDTDSYQIARFPCPVALETFLDPRLYGVHDFSSAPVFSTQTDWYAFAVLLVKSLLQVHPYGGMHRVHKSLRARAEARVSVFDTAVTYPQRARPLDTLSDDLLHHLHLIFEKDYRDVMPLASLIDYAKDLIDCPQCHLSYPRQRMGCPACHLQMPTPQPIQSLPLILQKLNGFIEHVGLRPNGRFWCIVRQDDQYKLVRLGKGGILDEKPLFSGTPGYRFGLFDHYLVVNPPQGSQLLILDNSKHPPHRVEMIETAAFRETAVFATTPRYLYRIAGTWVMRGTVQDGHYVEDAVATAHRDQTQFWASPHNDTIAGYHRIFAEYRYFLRNANGDSFDLAILPLRSGESMLETAVRFHPNEMEVLLKIKNRNQLRTEVHQFNLNGQRIKSSSYPGDAFEKMVELNKHVLLPT